VTVTLPGALATNLFPVTETTLGLLDVYTHGAVDVLVGFFSSNEEIPFTDSEILGIVETTGKGAVIVTLVVVVALNQLDVANCVAVIVASPPSTIVAIFPKIVITSLSGDE
jgi:hypothetical protein